MDREIIYGNRIFLRPISEEDTDMVLLWRNSDKTVRNFYYRVPVTKEDHKKWLSEKVETGQVWQYIVCLKEGEIPIGCVYVQHIDERSLEGETGLFFSENGPAGQGYGTESLILFSEEVCFKKLGLLRLNAKVQSANEASRHVHEKAGYKLIRTVKGEKCSDGEIVTSVYYRKDASVYDAGGRISGKIIPAVKACTGRIDAGEDAITVEVPGSKSITNRALLIAMLSMDVCTLDGILFSDDTESFLSCMDSLGIVTEVDRKKCSVKVYGCAGDIPNKSAHLNVGSAGTAARFLTAVLGLCDGGEYHMDSSEQMKKRPMKPLLDSLSEMGCEVIYEGEKGFFPFTLRPHGFCRYEVTVDIDKSSQFLSALLIAAPLSQTEMKIHVTGSHGLSYVEMTMKIMEAFGAECRKESAGETNTYTVSPTGYLQADYHIEPDASAACYFAAMSPITGKPLILKNLHKNSMQGDVRFIGILEELGIIASEDTDAGIKIIPQKSDIKSKTTDNSETLLSEDETVIDMSSCSDQTITLAAIAPVLNKKIRITGISHIRLQESDRISAIVTELKRIGVNANEDGDEIVISAGENDRSQDTGAGEMSEKDSVIVRTYNDHRMAMGFSLAGFYNENIVIGDPLCCAKTFPDYFAYFDEMVNTILN